jgi:hypothetical protein
MRGPDDCCYNPGLSAASRGYYIKERSFGCPVATEPHRCHLDLVAAAGLPALNHGRGVDAEVLISAGVAFY